MSLLVRTRSQAVRLREHGTVRDEQFGPLHAADAMLQWGSIGKTVTAMIAERLGRSGALDLAAPVIAYLPTTELPEAVDVRSLITHTSGLPRIPSDMLTSVGEMRDPYAKYTTDYVDAHLLPGLGAKHSGAVGAFEYSNLGYGVLTRLMELATGCDWWTLAKREVFDPLGIADVAVSPDPARVPVLRTWTGRVRRQWTIAGPFLGAGGVYGTFDALEQYALAVAQQNPGAVPLGWMESPTLWWHNGHAADHGAFVGFSHDGSRVVTAHTLGYRAGVADKIAAHVQRRHPTRKEHGPDFS